VGFEGSALEKILFDIAVLSATQAADEKRSLTDEIKAKYAKMRYAKLGGRFRKRKARGVV